MKYFHIVIEHVQKAIRPFYALLVYPLLLVGGANAGPANNVVKFPKPLKPSLSATQGMNRLRREGDVVALRKTSDDMMITNKSSHPITITSKKAVLKQPRQQVSVVKEGGARQPANIIYANFKCARQNRPERFSQANNQTTSAGV